MLEMKYGLNLTIPGGPEFSLSNKLLQSEVYQHFNLTLNAQNQSEKIVLSGLQGSNLLTIKAKKTFAPDSSSELTYKVGDDGEEETLDAPLLIAGTWLKSLIASNDDDELIISFNLDPGDSSDDYVNVEVIFGKPEADA